VVLVIVFLGLLVLQLSAMSKTIPKRQVASALCDVMMAIFNSVYFEEG
jgi:hypothetical protein